jgi:DNA-binding MarR family transcriptional regulator
MFGAAAGLQHRATDAAVSPNGSCPGNESLDNGSLGRYISWQFPHGRDRLSPEGEIFTEQTVGDIYDNATYQPCRTIGSLMSRVKAEMLAALDRELSADKRLAPLEMSAAQYIIIANLAGPQEPKSAAELCKGISYDAGAMTRMLDRLESKGLIRRTRSVQDRRLMELELTEEGRAAYPRMREISMSVANRFLRGFSKAEARQLEGLLNRMLENAHGTAARASA